MNSQPQSFEYVRNPSELYNLQTGSEFVTKNIEFVSVLTSIDFQPSSRCLLTFHNFEDGIVDSSPYTCIIRCNTPDTLNLTKMTLSLLSQQFDLDIPEVDDPSGFNITELHLDRLCLAHIKGRFTRNKNRGAIMLQGIRSIDLHSTLYVAKSAKTSDDIASLTTIFDDLITLNNNSKTEFKFVKLVNYDNEMKQFVQMRQEKLLLKRSMKNPIFGVTRHLLAVESQDDFNSQDVDTQPTYHDSIQRTELRYAEQPVNHTKSAAQISNSKSFSNDPIVDSEASQTRSATNTSSLLDLSAEFPSINQEHMKYKQLPRESTVSSGGYESTKGNTYVPLTNLREFNDRIGRSQTYEHTRGDIIVSQLDQGSQPQTEASFSPNCLNSSDTSSVTYTNDANMISSQQVSENPPSKRRKLYEVPMTISGPTELSLTSASSDETFQMRGAVVGILPKGSSEKFCLRLFFRQIDQGQVAHQVQTVNPHTNSIEIIAFEEELMKGLELSSSIHTSFLDKFRAYSEKGGLVDVQVQKHPFCLAQGYFSFSWALKSICLTKDATTGSQDPFEKSQIVISEDSQGSQSSQVSSSSQKTSDPLKKFEDINLKHNCDVEFIRVFALLVAARKRGGNMRKFVFTDFTSHPLNTISAFDSFIGSYRDRISQDKAFMFIMYDDVYLKFARRLRSAIGCDFTELFTGSDNNVTHKGIVCDLLLKVKIYNGGIDGIVRSCLPVKVHDRLPQDERRALLNFYHKSVQFIPQYHLAEYFQHFSVFYPLKMINENVVVDYTHMEKKTSTTVARDHPQNGFQTTGSTNSLSTLNKRDLPQLNLEISQFQIIKDVEIPVLHNIDSTASNVVYDVRGKVVAMSKDDSQLIIYITNDYISQDLLDPTRILRIDIIGPENLNYFFSVRNYQQQHRSFNFMIGHIFSFKLSRAVIPVSATTELLIWSPIECTLEEMWSQLNIRNSDTSNLIKEEQIETCFSI